MKIIRFAILVFVFAATLPILLLSKDPKPKAEDLVKIELFTDHVKALPGSTFLLAVKFTIQKDWHTYWVNPGDAGLPTVVELDLPQGWHSSEMIFPIPQKIKFGEFANYGYEKEVMHMMAVTIAPTAVHGNVKIDALIKFLVCKEECLTGSKKQSFSINISHMHELNIEKLPLFGQFTSELPIKEHPVNAAASIVGDRLTLNLSGELHHFKNLTFFPIEEGYMVNGAEQKLTKAGISTTFGLELDQYREANPERIKGLIVSDTEIITGKPNRAIYIDIPIINK
jgi:DsbC/DsbD-like thiol-disulfide interchange protein